ncbi:MAG: AMP-binding protein, partial [bacterium]|nr:AMP-binding protein [bacterium]
TGEEDFSQIRYILLGGEALRGHETGMYKKYFPHYLLANIYGQTESSDNSIYIIDRNDQYQNPLIGTPLDETEIFVIDDEGQPVDELDHGEILVASPYISPGYWKNPEATKKVFSSDDDLGRLYWTGDLGCPRLDGSIEFLGRRDHQIKIRGYRVELGEIETCLLTHPAISETAVTARENEDRSDKYLNAYVVHTPTSPGNKITGSRELREYLSQRLPDYMIPSFFVPLEKMPLTVTGKIDRKALPEPAHMQREHEYVPPAGTVEKKLVAIWTEILQIKKNTAAPAAQERLGVEDNFFELGGHSLKATLLQSRIHKAFDVKITLADIFKKPTIRTIAQIIKQTAKTTFTPLTKADKKEYYPLSPAQQRLYVLQRLDEKGTGYNLPVALVLKGKLDVEKLEKVFRKLIDHHESLRTSFHFIDHATQQKIHEFND